MIIFDAFTQKDAEHKLTVDHNGEIVATAKSGHFLKFPAGSTEKQIRSYVEKHGEANTGQVSAEEHNKLIDKSKKMIESLSDTTDEIDDEQYNADETSP
ncbi:MAG: hypothetical protein H0U60_20095 [Blastocatellia bacterium]|nr:hypothetical protein [Blastocatellia bacterium]